MPLESLGTSVGGPSSGVDIDRHFRRAVWIAALCTAVGASIVYAAKAADDRSAFIRWRHQVLEFMDGSNIFDKYYYPNPPIMPLSLYPFMLLPAVAGATAWFWLKVILTGLSFWLLMRMVYPPGISPGEQARSWGGNFVHLVRNFGRDPVPPAIPGRQIPSWVQFTIVLASLRPIMSDLHHGNNNLVILFLVVASLAAWRSGRDVLAGLVLALAITYKVTPGLFLAYYLYKGSWRTVMATGAGLAMFLFVVPSLFIGFEFNWICLSSWFQRILSPYVSGDVVGVQEINQSMVGTITRLLTEDNETGRYTTMFKDLNIASWDRGFVVYLVKGLSVGFVAVLAWLCRTKTERRDDPRLLGEFALVVLTMLFVSERSWKHHYVTLMIPFVYLGFRAFSFEIERWERAVLWSALLGSLALIGSTSSEIGGLFAEGTGHKVAQFYGMFFWAGLVLFIATAWRVRRERFGSPFTFSAEPREVRFIPAPHALRRDASVVSS
ncbi:MAG: glycosyltransferase family 87 protein [Isosphaeraceae bacterium]|nr:glycosyltransferase family 87 protein [Isosphaeraceae bacterium]